MSEELTVRYVPLSQVALWERNPKRHSIGDLAASIERYGFKEIPKYEPSLNNGQGGIVAGNGRIETLVALQRQNRPAPRGIVEQDGEWLVPITFGVDAPSQEEAEAYGLDSNNLGLAGGDFTAYDMARLWGDGYTDILSSLALSSSLPITVDGDALDGLLRGMEPEVIPGDGGDDFDTTPAEGPTRCQPGDLWIIGGVHRLLVGDCTDPANVARLMCGERAAIVVTSPPYNQKLDSFKPSGMQKENPAFVHRMASAYHDDMPESEYQERQIELLEMIVQFLTPNASIFYNHKIRYRDKRVVSPIEWLMRLPYVIRQEIIWDRGSSITLNARMFIPADERIYWLRVGDDFVFNDTPEIKSWGTVWEVAAVNEVQASAAFAIEIPTRCIRAASTADDIVFDPYCGSGTTLIAAHRLGRRGFGIERESRHADVILRRAEAEGLPCERAE